MLSSVLLYYTSASIVRMFFITAASFGALSLYGYTTQRDLSAMGSFLIMGLFGTHHRHRWSTSSSTARRSTLRSRRSAC